MRAAVVRYIDIFGLFSARPQSYESLPGHDRDSAIGFNSGSPSAKHWPKHSQRLPVMRVCKFSPRFITTTIVLVSVVVLLATYKPISLERPREKIYTQEEIELVVIPEEDGPAYRWQSFPRLNGFYNGIKTIVPWEAWEPDPIQSDSYNQPKLKPRDEFELEQPALPLKPERYSPYPDYQSSEYLSTFHKVNQCFLDANDTKLPPDVFMYPGVPQHMAMPFFGAYQEFGLRHDICFERFGRLGPYGYGYGAEEGGLGLGTHSEDTGSEEVWKQQPKTNWKDMDWGEAQMRCVEKNKHRFTSVRAEASEGAQSPDARSKKLSRTAYVLRTWTGFEYTAHEILTLRSMITELALKSGGEYDVHLLLHVRDNSIPIWSSDETYQQVIEDNIPKEFWNITTLWSTKLMELYYPGPFNDTLENYSGSSIHGVYRSAHFAIQWFSQQHPEYDYVWNWEMDVRYSGHHYEFHDNVVKWAKTQPRKGLWERNAKFWIPAYHGDWKNFTEWVNAETIDNGHVPVWGPVSFPNTGRLEPPPETKPPHGYFDDNFEWGVGEEADLITFNPIFDVQRTNWVFRNDITGYSLELPPPPRKCAIVTVARLSRRMLDIMHKETFLMKHSAFPEMWPSTAALHHGLKAVYVPHAVYFDRKWSLEHMNDVFNYPKTTIDSPFGWGEHNWLGSSFYYNSGFSGALWRRWLGERENNEGGTKAEKEGTGRMCLRPSLHHPIKTENFPLD